MTKRLTEYSPAGGCACKLPAEDLRALLPDGASSDPYVVVDHVTLDDCAVLRVNETLVACTIDFITPIVDDPRDFGRIAAANALSDIYAMGGRPIGALAILVVPRQDVPFAPARAILAGAREVLDESGASLVGGHTVAAETLLFGLSVTGTLGGEPLTNARARVGDAIALTKPIGGGSISTAIRRGIASAESVAAAVAAMTRLNAEDSVQARSLRASALTDVSGYGVVGHLSEMMEASGTSAIIHADRIPVLPGGRELLANSGGETSGGLRNRTFFAATTVWDAEIDDVERRLLHDPMTSGGLLVAVPANADMPENWARIGCVVERTGPLVSVVAR